MGEGTVYRRKDGKWAAEVTVSWSGGKRQRRRRVAPTKREAKTKLDELRSEHKEGVPVDADRLTVEQWLIEWLEREAKPSVRARTYHGYWSIVYHHLIPAIGSIKLRKLEARHVRDMLQAKAQEKGRHTGRPLSSRYVQYIHSVLRIALKAAVAYDLVPTNVAQRAKPPRVRRKEITPFTTEQAKAFLRAIEGERLEPLFQLAATTGMRQSELLGLQWRDLDLDNEVLFVRRTLQRYNGAYHLDETKTERSRRAVPVPAQVIETLRNHRERQEQERAIAGKFWQGDDWDLVFATEVGGPLSGSSVSATFKRILRRNGLPDIRFHDLRHGVATFLLAKSVEMRVVMDVLGHADIATTSNLYTHVLPELRQDAARKLGETLFG